ncbi:MAG: copper homeostasis protein CutC, partial [Aequorivita sp.]|nr:copper homeostasis protein CutC [Aequorivita sp.]
MKKLEIACFNLDSALIAQNAGADRVELCTDISLGGITPNLEMIQEARQKLTIDLYVMIRPRGGNFVYSDTEL